MVRKLIALGILGLLIGCTTYEPYPIIQSGAPAIEAGSLVFTGADGNLYVAQSGSSELIRLTDDARRGDLSFRYSGYAWANDRVVYVTQEADRGGDITSTMYSVLPGRRRERLFRQAGLAPFFLNPAPDGSRVGYLGSESGKPGFVMGSVSLDDGTRVIHGRGQPFYAAWKPDGSELVTHIGSPGARGGSELAIQQVEGLSMDDPSAEALELAPGVFQTPEYAPDGSRIAVILRQEGDAGIHILDDTGADLGRLVRLRGQAASFSWSPTGSRLAYIDGLYSQIGALVGRLAVARFGSQQPRVVSETAIGHFWSPDGTKLLFFEPVLLRSGNSPTLAYRVGIYSLLEDRRSIVATMRPAPDFATQIVPFLDQYERGYTLWSPDSRLIALNSIATDGTQIVHLLDTDTLQPGDSFRVGYRPLRVQDGEALGLVPTEGVLSRALAIGSIPFFSRD